MELIDLGKVQLEPPGPDQDRERAARSRAVVEHIMGNVVSSLVSPAGSADSRADGM